MTPEELAKVLYGYLGWFVDHPEIGPKIAQAAKEGWDKARLQGAIAQTDWWKKTSESSRKWDTLVVQDSATAERRVDETALSIALQAAQLGLRISQARLGDLATTANRFGWNEAEVKLAIAAEMKYDPNANATGSVGKMMADVKRTAAEYMVPVDDKQAWTWARRIAAGAATMDNVTAQFGQLAKARFPHLADDIDAGLTPGQFFTPYRNYIGELLEVSPDSIDLMESKWAPVISYRSDKGLRPMTLSETERYARTRPEWSQTNNAWETISGTGAELLELFGGMNT